MLRMIANVEELVGAMPVARDLFDIRWRANRLVMSGYCGNILNAKVFLSVPSLPLGR